ncbi:MAG: hypothetical protein ACPIOQ_58805, partial [Promethearchaeia archaeon]
MQASSPMQRGPHDIQVMALARRRKGRPLPRDEQQLSAPPAGSCQHARVARVRLQHHRTFPRACR